MLSSFKNLTVNPVNVDGERVLHVKVITLAFLCPTLLGSLPLIGPAFDSALEDIKVQYPKLNFTQTIVSTNRAGCSLPDWTDIYEDVLAEFYFKGENNARQRFDLTTFVISGADDALGVQRLASAVNKLMISSVASAQNGKAPYSTWVTTAVISLSTDAKMYEGLVGLYNWTNIVLIYDLKPGSNPYFKMTADVMAKYMRGISFLKMRISILTVNSGTFNASDYVGLMRNIQGLCRVVFYFGITIPLQNMLAAAARLNMTNGEYVFLGITPFWLPTFSGTFQWTGDGASDDVAKSAFRCFLLLETFAAPDSQNSTLYLQWRRLSRERYNYTYPDDVPLSPHPAATYAAMMTLAESIASPKVTDEIRQQERWDILSDGRRLARLFANRTFTLRTGKIRFNEDREYEPDLMVTQANPATSKRTMVFRRDADTGRLESTGPVEWPAVWPVLNEPICGFNGKALRCLENDSGAYRTVQFGASFGTVLVIISLAMIIVLIRVRCLAEPLDRSWWLLEHPLLLYEERAIICRTLVLRLHVSLVV